MEKIQKSTISIFRHTFDRLKEQANPAEIERAHTMDAVINRALDALEEAGVIASISMEQDWMQKSTILISIFPHTFDRLKEWTDPLDDPNPIDAVINNALCVLEEEVVVSDLSPSEDHRIDIDPGDLPDVTYTKVLDAKIDGEKILNPYYKGWNGLFHQMVIRSKKISDSEAFWKIWNRQPIPVFPGRRPGYKYLDEVDVSVGIENANKVLRAIVTVAKCLGIRLDIDFQRRKIWGPHAGKKGGISV